MALEGFKDWVDPISSDRLRGESMICLTSLLDFLCGCARRPKGPDKLVLALPLSLELFTNPRCPPVPIAIKATRNEVHHSEGLHIGQHARHRFGPML